MAYTWLLHLMVLSVTMATEGYISKTDDDPIGCHDAKTRCEAEPGCRQQLDAVPKVCGYSIYSCPLVSRSECIRLLVSLQMHPFFRSCTCNRTEAKANQCLVVLKTIFLHDCVTQDGAHSNVSWLEPRQLQQQSQTEGQDDDDEDDDDEEDDDDPSDSATDDDFLPSCIGVRRQCLHDEQCGHLLAEYRNHCPEKKKQNECIASERRRCFGAINFLREAKPELFDCACSMKKRKTRDRCERIQWRLANNTCLVTIPYLVHTLKFPELTYEELLTAANKDRNSYNTAGNCVSAFKNCHSDSNCRSRLSHLLSECSFGLSGPPPSSSSSSSFHGPQPPPRNVTRCDRRACQEAFRAFFLLVRPERTQDLLFCRCPRDPPAGDERCETVRRALSPPCALVELPPPTCIDLIDRCLNSSDCRSRWKNFEEYCAYDRSIGGCFTGPALCRSSLIGIAGTDLTINCTCPYTDPDKQRTCLEVRNRLKLTNTCIEMAIDNFHFVQTTTTQRIIAEYSSDGASQSDTSHALPDCGRHIGQKIPSFMSMPTVLRIYTNDTDCSEVCQCLRNRSVTCRTLPCAPNQSCKHRDVVYVHGASFLFNDRGQCRCIKGEMVCTKSHISYDPAQGLFLHTGYSISDQYLIEANTDVRFRSESITTKLGTLLNEDSAEQFCSLSLHRSFEGNLIFIVSVSKFSPKQSNNVESCMYPTKMLSNLINSRNSAIVNDAELSIIKVAQVERVKFHQSPATSGKRDEIPGNTGSSVIHWKTKDTDDFRLRLILVATASYLLCSTRDSLKRDVLVKFMISS